MSSSPLSRTRAYVPDATPAHNDASPDARFRPDPGLSDRQAALLATEPATPCLVVDTDLVARNYDRLAEALPEFGIYYAVKANPLPAVVAAVAKRGGFFDVASPAEIALCLDLGVSPDRLSYGNTIKKAADIAYAHDRGVRLFAFDCRQELDKIAEHAPGAEVFCRIFVDNEGAEWPLSKKFGCGVGPAIDLLCEAKALGLKPRGTSFHVGSQQNDVTQWRRALWQAAEVARGTAARGVTLDMINVGGGLPTPYTAPILSMAAFGDGIRQFLAETFPDVPPTLIVEPGRYLVGDAGVIEAEVVLVSDRGDPDGKRWVYLDIGRFSGLAETEGEAIKYRITTNRDGDPVGPVVLAGPTCDSVDVMYEKTPYQLPLTLRAGDRVRILATGAYTLTYASVGFNGFEPVRAEVVGSGA